MPAAVVELALRLLDDYGVKHAALTLQLQGNLRSGCCGALSRNPTLAAALHGVAHLLEACADAATARERLRVLAKASSGSRSARR